jgi:hypothetical protein
MPERPELPADLVMFANALIEEWGEHMTGQLGELANVLRSPAPVRAAASDRLRCSTVGVPFTGQAPQLLGYQLDRARVTLVNKGSVDVYIGGPEVSSGLAASRFTLEPGDALTVDTRDAIHALANGADGTLGLLVEEWDP